MRKLPLILSLGLLWGSASAAAAQVRTQSAPPPSQGQAGAAQWRTDHYTVTAQDHHGRLTIRLIGLSGVAADLYVKRGSAASPRDFDFKSAVPFTADEEVVITADSRPALRSAVYHIAVVRSTTTNYSIQYFPEVVASTRPGMGADRYRSTEVNGTSFRVWAPFADSVHLAGSFNGWSDTAMPMVAEGNGN